MSLFQTSQLLFDLLDPVFKKADVPLDRGLVQDLVLAIVDDANDDVMADAPWEQPEGSPFVGPVVVANLEPVDLARVDPGIRDLIRDLNAAGYETISSCQGTSKARDRHLLQAYVAFDRKIAYPIRHMFDDGLLPLYTDEGHTTIVAAVFEDTPVQERIAVNALFPHMIRGLFLNGPFDFDAYGQAILDAQRRGSKNPTLEATRAALASLTA